MRNDRAPAGTRRRTSRWWRCRRSRWSGWRRPARAGRRPAAVPVAGGAAVPRAVRRARRRTSTRCRSSWSWRECSMPGGCAPPRRRCCERHANLRASIHHEGLERPVQVIPRAVEVPWREMDLSALAGRGPAGTPRRSCWRPTGRSGSCPSAGRCCAGPCCGWARSGTCWCSPTTTSCWTAGRCRCSSVSCVALYRNGGDTDALPRVRPYADYLAWLAAQDAGAALAAWRDYLADLDGPTRLAPPGDAGRFPDDAGALADRPAGGADRPAAGPGAAAGPDAEHGGSGAVGGAAGAADGPGRRGLRRDGVGPAGGAGRGRADGGAVHQHRAPAGAAASRGAAGDAAGRDPGEPGAAAGLPARGAGGDPAGGGDRRAVRHAGGVRELPGGPCGACRAGSPACGWPGSRVTMRRTIR